MWELEGAHQVHYGSTREHQLLDEWSSRLRFLERNVNFYLTHEGFVSPRSRMDIWYCGARNSTPCGGRAVEALRGHDLVRGTR